VKQSEHWVQYWRGRTEGNWHSPATLSIFRPHSAVNYTVGGRICYFLFKISFIFNFVFFIQGVSALALQNRDMDKML
jgi:hypothetical protein